MFVNWKHAKKNKLHYSNGGSPFQNAQLKYYKYIAFIKGRWVTTKEANRKLKGYDPAALNVTYHIVFFRVIEKFVQAQSTQEQHVKK